MRRLSVICIECSEDHGLEMRSYRCRCCGGPLEVRVETDQVFSLNSLSGRVQSIWRYEELLPDLGNPVTLGEGMTRLVRCERLAKLIGVRNLYVKLEGTNPTGSFKDRGISVGVTVALRAGADKVVCASTGNTAASLAAYAARAGLECAVLIPKGKVASGKLFQARLFGAVVCEVSGTFDDALRTALREAESIGAYVLNSVNPWRLEGQKTAAFELWEQMSGDTSFDVVVPVGNAGNISAIWKGFEELSRHGLIDDLPRMIGAQSSGAAPLARMMRLGLDEPSWVDDPQTIASAIRIGRPVNWKRAIRAVRRSGGMIYDVEDSEILEAMRLMATSEGIATEPAGAAPIALLKSKIQSGELPRDLTYVCIATGHHLKDPSSALVSWNEPVPVEDYLTRAGLQRTRFRE
ncbi:MAG: threonine synthase [Thaumarchaeota archaeon]|nr:threonine synthase [Candidatus Calditenuaceae archaeon]MDW8186792.1 threonine synthase [Nitrososphaerota archaeon]